ncbi:MAG: FtsX-like permease family protein, partial [Bacteroidota bacterium]
TLLKEPFNQLTGKQLPSGFDASLVGMGFLLILIVGFIAGIYPAIYLSKLKVISALRAKLSGNQKKNAFGRQALVFIQFTLSIMLITGTLIVGSQMDYALHKNLGYDRDNLVYFLREGRLIEDADAFNAAIGNIPGVLAVSKTNFSIGPNMQNRTMGLSWEEKSEDNQVAFWENKGDEKSVEILDLQLIAGRNFSNQFNEENSVIFNETAIKAMGMENPIGKFVEHYSGKKEIIGVVQDFTTESLHNTMEPAMFFYRPDRTHYIMVKIAKGREIETIKKLEEIYKSYNPLYPFEPQFIDQDYQAMYAAEMRVATMSRLFAVLAILISCLGLFGLTIFQIQRKIKEIGIKKVLGADTWKLAVSMTYKFTKSVFAALVVALPVSYFIGSKWLENYAESISLSWWMFGIAALVAIIISWITVGTQTLRAANANPVESLKDD